MMLLNLKTVSRYEYRQKYKCQKSVFFSSKIRYKVSDIVDSALLLTYKYYYLYV